MLGTVLIVVFFLAIVYNLGAGLYFMMTDKGGTDRTLKALTRRIAISVGLILLVMFAADHPRLLSRSRAQLVRLDRAIMDERELHREAEARLGLPIQALDVKEVNLVNDTTLVEVRYTRPHASTVPVSLRRAA